MLENKIKICVININSKLFIRKCNNRVKKIICKLNGNDGRESKVIVKQNKNVGD